MQMVESRRAERVRSFLRARVIYNNGNSSLDCVVRNMSATGAKIEIGKELTLPAQFDLDVPQKGRMYRAKLVWRDAEAIGVEFVRPDTSEAAAANDARADRLERENKRLRAMVAELTKRLEDIGQAVDQVI